jgi:acetoin:2,6-dichlorophenolindophenol oxidoreductase subunit alpha
MTKHADVDVATSSAQSAEPLALLRAMTRIRRFEKQALRLIHEGLIWSIHAHTGHEAISVGVASSLREDDEIFITYRGHGHALARGMTAEAGFGELLARESGCTHGWGGTHMFTDHGLGVMVSETIVAGGVPIAVGRARAAQLRGEDIVAVSFFGDGATNQGTIHEAFVLAVMWNCPVVFVCENNQFSEMTPISSTVPGGSVANRVRGYPMAAATVDGNDLDAVRQAASDAVAHARSGSGPYFLEMMTFRQDGHYIGDTAEYIPAEVRATWLERDPITRFRQQLLDSGVATEQTIEAIEKDVEAEIEDAVRRAKEAAPTDVDRFAAFVNELEPTWN